MDGRVQYPVLDYLKKQEEVEFFDAANEAGPLRILTDRTDKCRLISLKEQIRTSIESHGSKLVVVVGHHDCGDNPVDRTTQEQQMKQALEYLEKAFGSQITYVGLYVNEHWEVEEVTRRS
jgi:3-phosphoglycerate kinase